MSDEQRQAQGGTGGPRGSDAEPSGGVDKDQLLREELARTREPAAVCRLLKAAFALCVRDAVDLVGPFVRSADDAVRLTALELLSQRSDPRALAWVAELVGHPDSKVARMALESLEPRAPEVAVGSLRTLVATHDPHDLRRAMDLAGSLRTPVALPLALEALERGVDPIALEPLTRLVVRWGNLPTLTALSALHRRVGAEARPHVLGLATELARKLGVSQETLAARFKEGPPTPGTTRPTPAVPPRRILPRWARWAAAAAVPVIALAVLAFLEPGPSAKEAPPGGADGRADLPIRILPPTASVASWPEHEGPAGPPGADETATPAQAAPLLAEVEAALRETLAAQGIASPAIVHLAALDRVHLTHLREIDRAREALARGEVDAALSILEAALERLDPEHLLGRLAVLRAIEAACIRARRFERLKDWRARMAEVERRLRDVCLEAARSSGMPQDQVAEVLAALEAQDKAGHEVSRTGDFFSGATLASAGGGETDTPDVPPVAGEPSSAGPDEAAVTEEDLEVDSGEQR